MGLLVLRGKSGILNSNKCNNIDTVMQNEQKTNGSPSSRARFAGSSRTGDDPAGHQLRFFWRQCGAFVLRVARRQQASRFPSLCKLSAAAGRFAFLVFPSTYNASQDQQLGALRPLVVDLHPFTVLSQFGPDVAAANPPAAELEISLSAWYGVADSAPGTTGPLVLVPQGLGSPLSETWNAGQCCNFEAVSTGADDTGFITGLVTTVIASGRVDAARVFASGFSNGAYMCERLVCEKGTVFAGIVSNSGSIVLPTCAPASKMNVFLVHGTADANVPYHGGNVGFGPIPSEAAVVAWWKAVNNCTGPPVAYASPGEATCVEYCNGTPTSVILCTVTGGGHTYYGSYLDSKKLFPTTSAGWTFLASKSRSAALVPANVPGFLLGASAPRLVVSVLWGIAVLLCLL